MIQLYDDPPEEWDSYHNPCVSRTKSPKLIFTVEISQQYGKLYRSSSHNSPTI